MADTPNDDEPNGGQEDYFEPNGIEDPDDVTDASGDSEWTPGHIPSLEGILRSSMLPIFNRISELSAAMMPKITPPRFDVPEIQLAPEVKRSLIDINRMLEPWREAVAAMVDWRRLARSVIDPGLTDRLRDLIARRMPPNWSAVEDWRDAARFVEDTGWTIIWLPRGEVVAALLDAPPDGRETVLLEHMASIVDDAIACAREVQRGELAFVADCIVEIGESIRAGRHRAAQALAGSVLTELIQGILGHEELGRARAEYQEPWEEKSIRILRFSLITSAIPMALERFYRQKGDPIPGSFNRHAVAHAASPVQFTPVNAVVGLMLVAALTRELQELFDEGVLVDD